MRGSWQSQALGPLGHGGFEHLRDRVLSLAWTGLLQPYCQESGGGQWDLPGPEAQLSFKQMPFLYYMLVMVAASIQGGGVPCWLSIAGNSCFLVCSGNPSLPRSGPPLQAPPETGKPPASAVLDTPVLCSLLPP